MFSYQVHDCTGSPCRNIRDLLQIEDSVLYSVHDHRSESWMLCEIRMRSSSALGSFGVRVWSSVWSSDSTKTPCFFKTAVSMDSCDGCDILGALLLVAHDDGDLDDDDLLVLAAMEEFASARGLLRIDFSLHLGNRLHLSSLDDEMCSSRFRFTRKQIEELMIGMQIPDEFRSPCRTKWFGLDGLLIVLRRLAYPARLADLVSEVGRSEAVLSLIFNTMLGWISTRWGHVLSNPFAQPYFTASRIASYARAVRQKSSVNLDVWGFIDGTVGPICRPGLHQRMFFNGHKRIHALKFQIVITPDGLIAHAFGPEEGCRHDAGVLGESGLLPLLQQNMNGRGVCLMPCMETPPTLSAVIFKKDFRELLLRHHTDNCSTVE